jgi:hypothetical protein
MVLMYSRAVEKPSDMFVDMDNCGLLTVYVEDDR